jgi:osmotically-inducible protein OsmY
MATGNVIDSLSIKTKNMAPDTDTVDFKTKIEILLKLAVIPDVKIVAPKVSVKNGTVTLGGIVNAHWKRAYIANIVSTELPGRVVENKLTVIPPRQGDFPPERHPVKLKNRKCFIMHMPCHKKRKFM